MDNNDKASESTIESENKVQDIFLTKFREVLPRYKQEILNDVMNLGFGEEDSEIKDRFNSINESSDLLSILSNLQQLKAYVSSKDYSGYRLSTSINRIDILIDGFTIPGIIIGRIVESNPDVLNKFRNDDGSLDSEMLLERKNVSVFEKRYWEILKNSFENKIQSINVSDDFIEKFFFTKLSNKSDYKDKVIQLNRIAEIRILSANSFAKLSNISLADELKIEGLN